ncbi:MAG: DNA primase [Candidatus Magasanikbacteria bacterium RIFCSPHIGHO2_01_FULL_33_34]|uniref:DNA primase n=1 Tax=Candidatus Magasanikbacteria bacterium RIFCSPHIGHO2_01_FULL_33_34 TaxID=1798671 RepID=A0A1F6LL05_9BACT|nr:MAG: DNA primase [Candidatus Magasanikbacteria bacterium RIFCSPHIGHO2_01_FULL_33_34]
MYMSDTQLIKDKLDIADFISEYIQLKPAGINHKGCCPFHQEKTPSFMVNRERQSWHCFGCSKGGDIFSFLQEIEGMEFVEALKFLADRAGVQLEFRSSEVNSSQKNRIKEINKEATRFFYNFLLKMPASRNALKYLEERGLTQETIENWQIGFVPDQWELLTKYLLKKGYSIDDLVASGLTIKREGASNQNQSSYYDRFRGRIMFPIWDVHDTVVGFTGRVLVETEKSGGKYVNTPQTVVYDKSRVVFGLNKAKSEIKSKDLIVMVEGQMDVIACHQVGMTNVVATSGTAMTEQQVKLLKRYSNNMSIAFDADVAGQAAAKRGIDLAMSEGMDVKVIIIPDGKGKDPDECIKNNKQVWFDSVANAKGIMDWYFSKALEAKDLSDPKQKQNIADILLKEIILIPYAVEQDHWLRELGTKLNVDVSVLRENMAQIKNSQKKKDIQQNQKNEPMVNNKLYQNTRLDILLERFFMALLKFPDNINKENLVLDSVMLSFTNYGPLYELLNKLYNNNASIDVNQLRDSVDNNNKEIVDLLLMKGDLEFTNFTVEETKNEIKQLLDQINIEWLKKRRQDIQVNIIEAEKRNDQDALKVLLENFQKIK